MADDEARMVRRRFLNPNPACECGPGRCDHSYYWPEQGILEHRPQSIVEIRMPADQPCPFGLVEVGDKDKPKKVDAPATATTEGA